MNPELVISPNPNLPPKYGAKVYAEISGFFKGDYGGDYDST